MRRYLLILPFVFECAKGEEAPADSAAMAAAPAALTDADVSGTWTGVVKIAGTDSILAHFSITCGAGTCRGTSTESPKDTVQSTYVLQADSAVGTSAAYNDPMMKVSVIDHWVARPVGSQVTGTGRFVLATKPDSVLANYTFTGSRAP